MEKCNVDLVATSCNQDSAIVFSSIHRPQKARITELEEGVGELALLCKTLMRMLLEKGVCTGQEINALMKQLDLEDGVEDGRVTKTAGKAGGRCPKCDHAVMAARKRCLYCGHELRS